MNTGASVSAALRKVRQSVRIAGLSPIIPSKPASLVVSPRSHARLAMPCAWPITVLSTDSGHGSVR